MVLIYLFAILALFQLAGSTALAVIKEADLFNRLLGPCFFYIISTVGDLFYTILNEVLSKLSYAGLE